MYNDQPPMSSDSKGYYAHSKGAVAFSESDGFWIISSVPRFPAKVSTGFKYGKSQTKKGQIILCVTVPGNMEDKIKQIFKKTKPFIYDAKNFAVERSTENDAVFMNFRTSGNVKLKLFAKPKRCEEDIYSHFIAPMLRQKIFVQSWMPKLDDEDRVKNIKYIRFNNELAFHTNVDHSKWAVAKGLPWTCIGDLNRDETQFRRGGLSLCLCDKNVAKEFRKIYRLGYMKPPPLPKRPRNTCTNGQHRRHQTTQNQHKRQCMINQLT